MISYLNFGSGDRDDEGILRQGYAMTDEELDTKIEELHVKLTQSQCANSHPEQYFNYKRLSENDHFALWDEMWKLVQERESRRKRDSVR